MVICTFIGPCLIASPTKGWQKVKKKYICWLVLEVACIHNNLDMLNLIHLVFI